MGETRMKLKAKKNCMFDYNGTVYRVRKGDEIEVPEITEKEIDINSFDIGELKKLKKEKTMERGVEK